MSEQTLTVADLLFSNPQEAVTAEDHPATRGVQETIKKELKSVDMVAVNDALLHKLAELLDSPFIEGLAVAWSKSGEILKYRDREKYPPQNTYLVSLAKHTVTSDYRPAIEVFVNEVPRGKLQFQVTLSVELQAAQLEVRDARIRRVRPGSWEGSGEVSLEGKRFYRKVLEKVTLPGVMDLGEGVAIGE